MKEENVILEPELTSNNQEMAIHEMQSTKNESQDEFESQEYSDIK